MEYGVYKYAGKFFVSDDQEIYKCDEHGNWYVFRHGRWENQNGCCGGDSKPEWIVSEHTILGAARKQALVDWVKAFGELKLPDASLLGFNDKNMYYSKGDEDAPFWSEGFLYPLLGKEEARTVLGRLRRLEDISKACM